MNKLRIGLILLLLLVLPVEAGGYIATGRVDLQRNAPRGDSSWITELVVSAYVAGVCVNQEAVTCDEYGWFTYHLSPGRRMIGVKSAHSLETIRLQTSGDTGFGLLLEGDANDDNAVDDLDFDVMRDVYWTDSALADFNQDGQVNALDFSLLNSNYGRRGPIIYVYLAEVSK